MTAFVHRHIGPSEQDLVEMVQTIGTDSLETLISQTVPTNIRLSKELDLPKPLSEPEALAHMRELASQNQLFKSYMGQGYYNTHTPGVILRNIFENPGWYTQYTPYQAEISQGRLEALLNFQTVVSDLTGLPVANASLLDEATAAAEAMALLFRVRSEQKEAATVFVVDPHVFPQTLSVLKTRAQGYGITLEIADVTEALVRQDVYGILIQTPDSEGCLHNYRGLIEKAHTVDIKVAVATDLLALTLTTPPGEWGADVVVGSAQRFGVPLGYGGPHAAFFAVQDAYKRSMPGRIIGQSVDSAGTVAYRMALQTREQHIRREKATSNICTAQALLAIMAGMYAVYHGPKGLREIASTVHHLACELASGLTTLGYSLAHTVFFDTISVLVTPQQFDAIKTECDSQQLNIWVANGRIGISLDETTTHSDIQKLLQVFGVGHKMPDQQASIDWSWPSSLVRITSFLEHPTFTQHHSETQLLRYIKQLESKDLSLTSAMIPLGSCTMKLNATTQMMPLSWPEFANVHPFVPLSQTQGYQTLIQNLEQYLCKITGFYACSLQPNSGAQGEYAGLMAIRLYHLSRGDTHRVVVLIPTSAHGTNPATAAMLGMTIVLVACDENGNVNLQDLEQKAAQYAHQLAALMITYPSTHGVFEDQIQAICASVHQHGGQVYMDGANMNAQVGLTNPATIGADVCHLNLHKTFAIPHGGGGPGMGPICVAKHLAPFLPGHPVIPVNQKTNDAVSATPWGSASILIISYLYIRLLGSHGVTQSTKMAILNANYIKARLASHYPVLYTGKQGHVAHELILDCRAFKKSAKIEVEDIAKRLMDYGFHSPTMSFPVPGTLMIEPTESEDKEELDRFCEAMIQIRHEISQLENGIGDYTDNVLKQAPHTALELAQDVWPHGYSRNQAVYPLPYLKHHKFWPPVKRVDNAYGDRNLMCSCQVPESSILQH